MGCAAAVWGVSHQPLPPPPRPRPAPRRHLSAFHKGCGIPGEQPGRESRRTACGMLRRPRGSLPPAGRAAPAAEALCLLGREPPSWTRCGAAAAHSGSASPPPGPPAPDRGAERAEEPVSSVPRAGYWNPRTRICQQIEYSFLIPRLTSPSCALR